MERDIPAGLRAEVLKRDGRTCQYCGKPGGTLDHLVPVSRGGLSVRLNLLAACESCNQKKHAKELPTETLLIIRFFLKRERTVENGYPYMLKLVRQFLEQLAHKKPLEQARIRGIVGTKHSQLKRLERGR